ncbi:MAG: hypothetical protein AAGF95_26750 [Chloroflexota bacterium]
MTTVEQLQIEIEALPEQDFLRLRHWFAEKDWERWDEQLENDVVAGKLDFLMDEATTAKAQNALRDL